jgi:hypothetical protein
MTERAWYQDGVVVFWICVAVAFLYYVKSKNDREEQERNIPMVIPKLSGRLQQPLLGGPILEINLWHQHPGNLRNGRIDVSVRTSLVQEHPGASVQSHSFEVWEPNKDNTVTLPFQLLRFDAQEEILVEIVLTAKDVRPYKYTPVWIGNDWKSNQQAANQ